VASFVGGIPECVNDDVDALLFRQKSSRDLAAKVLSVYKNPERWDSIRCAARQNVETRYAADVIGEKIAGLLRSVIRA
jgi:glycosyltransferase involved in cell wall biosynthesis